ncbi:MAG: hypothetical protein U0T83_09700 [Bacteriovoracaceae bacterium]
MNKFKAPLIYNFFKPVGISSHHVIRLFKKKLNCEVGKIGHFGTLDPFAGGVLLIGINSGTRINDYVHAEFAKTYLLIGVLGKETVTGDNTAPISQTDTSRYLVENIKKFDIHFLNALLQDKFLGEYYQAPHVYSAAKFQGKKLHVWAKQGVNINLAPVKRYIYSLEIVKYAFPYLHLKVKASSGTYMRTLFSDIARFLGTLGHLVGLIRTEIGPFNIYNGIKKSNFSDQIKNWDENFLLKHGNHIDDVLKYSKIVLDQESSIKFKNGVSVPAPHDRENKNWIYDFENQMIGLGEIYMDENNTKKIRVVFNLAC